MGSELCANCDCVDKSQCIKKRDINELEPIYVYAYPREFPENPLDILWGNFPHILNERIKDNIHDDKEPIGKDEISAIFTGKEEVVRHLKERLEKIINEKQVDKTNYKRAKELFEKHINNDTKKLKKKDIEAIKKYLELDELKRIFNELDSMKRALGIVNLGFLVADLYEIGEAFLNGVQTKNWGPFFDKTVTLSINSLISIAASFIVATSAPSIIGISILVAIGSYFINEKRIHDLRVEVERFLEK